MIEEVVLIVAGSFLLCLEKILSVTSLLSVNRRLTLKMIVLDQF